MVCRMPVRMTRIVGCVMMVEMCCAVTNVRECSMSSALVSDAHHLVCLYGCAVAQGCLRNQRGRRNGSALSARYDPHHPVAALMPPPDLSLSLSLSL